MVGNVGLRLCPQHARGELGYLIGKRYWGRGYCTEAVRAALRYAFNELKLNRVFAEHFSRNPASGRVMQKTGMRYEGILRQHLRKLDGQFEDAVTYGILRAEAGELLGEGDEKA
jgi:RimJ/RimL family protein N-acetyltransferase